MCESMVMTIKDEDRIEEKDAWGYCFDLNRHSIARTPRQFHLHLPTSRMTSTSFSTTPTESHLCYAHLHLGGFRTTPALIGAICQPFCIPFPFFSFSSIPFYTFLFLYFHIFATCPYTYTPPISLFYLLLMPFHLPHFPVT